MPLANVIEIPDNRSVVCPTCHAVAVDAEEGLLQQPSCTHIRYVYANGECFEYAEPGLEERLEAEQERADEEGEYFDPWDWLQDQSSEDGVILEQVTREGAAYAPVSFRVWVGFNKASAAFPRLPRLPRLSVCELFGGTPESWENDYRVFFRPTRQFCQWMLKKYGGRHIYDVGAGLGQVYKALTRCGMQVTAIDLEPREERDFPCIKADSTGYLFEKDSVVLLCRPCHDGFVEQTVFNALKCGVSAVVYAGLTRNVRGDLGKFHVQFERCEIRKIGRSGEQLFQMRCI